jgi:4-diphosphocytidyl-2-C-methyl-D-erythritol kinase
VYAEADRLGGLRSAAELESVDAIAATGVNDLEPAARSLEPSIEPALEAARAAGATHAMVSGSGPTVIGLFEAPDEAERAAAELASRGVAAVAARPVPRSTAGAPFGAAAD